MISVNIWKIYRSSNIYCVLLKWPLLNLSITDSESTQTRKTKTRTKTPLKGQKSWSFEPRNGEKTRSGGEYDLVWILGLYGVKHERDRHMAHRRKRKGRIKGHQHRRSYPSPSICFPRRDGRWLMHINLKPRNLTSLILSLRFGGGFAS